MASILIIDDNDAVRTALEVLLALQGHRVLAASSPDEGLRTLAKEQIDLVLQDMNFRKEATSGEEGVALFHAIRERYPTVPIVLLTAWTHLETAVELVKAGAADYVAKPWDDARLLTTIRNLLELRRLSVEQERAARRRADSRAALAQKFDLCGLVFESEAMRDVVTKATHIAAADVPILITGPNGSGKEVLAAIIQANSSVRGGPFIKVNVGALPKDLMEAELFGAEAGAYTGATKVRQGRFEAADGGTLFLDEIGNLSMEGQAKLLRVLQTGEFERLGSSTTRRVKVRVISATNSDLPAAITAGRFREDLYYRLNVIELKVPPLVERKEDILPLAKHFLEDGQKLSVPGAARAAGAQLARQRSRVDEHDPARVAAFDGGRDLARRSGPGDGARHAGDGAGARARPRRDRRRPGACPRRHRARGAGVGVEPPGAVSAHGEAGAERVRKESG